MKTSKVAQNCAQGRESLSMTALGQGAASASPPGSSVDLSTPPRAGDFSWRTKPAIDLSERCRGYCGRRRGELDNPNRWTRSLCGRCYPKVVRRGLLDEMGAPVKAPTESYNARTRPVGDRKLSQDGYVTVKTSTGVQQEHRIIMEEVLGRKLIAGENVHHINGIRHDNRPENLELWISSQPYGQRIPDLIRYLVEHHRPALREALGAECP